MAFYSCPSYCHPVRSTLQTCRHNCLDSSADRARSWLSSGTFHARAKFPFLVFVGDTRSLPSSKGSCLFWYSRLLTSSAPQACKPFESQSPAIQEVNVQRTKQWRERSFSVFTRSFLAQWWMWRTLNKVNRNCSTLLCSTVTLAQGQGCP